MAKKQKKHVSRVIRPTVVKALVLSETALSPRQQKSISAVTPKMFIKEKPGRGGKKVSYVEGGYVVSQLNQTFSPAGWDFEIVAQGESARKIEARSEGEVWVRGKLTIIDHKKGYRVSKTQYGQHPIHEKIPVGDAFKSAATDCLKKCASLFGIAHDVYWKISEEEGDAQSTPEKGAKKTSISELDIQKIKALVKSTRSTDILMQIDEKISGSPLYTAVQKKDLHSIISSKVDELDSQQA